MKSIVRMICRFVIVSLVFVSFQSTAAMIGTDQIATTHNERSQIHSMLARADVTKQLQAMGVDTKVVHERVAALTDEEARSLAGKLNAVPAGASDGWWILAAIIVGLIIWWRWR
ncbi:MAG TPA: PA2779 family protein [Burkholderiales bacterium]|nr:PA2779 family protein [Burkholderiales bacterium]